jgi:hypothetical protein
MADSVSGMYFTVDDEDGGYSVGRVTRLAAKNVYFVRFEGNEMPLPLELVTLGEMVQTSRGGYKLWRFFDSLEERDKWTQWLDTPSKPRVISLVRPTK